MDSIKEVVEFEYLFGRQTMDSITEVVEFEYKSIKIRENRANCRAPPRKSSFTAFQQAKLSGLMPAQQSRATNDILTLPS